MKFFLLVFVTLIISSCSFDNKTGIWKDASNIPVDDRVVETIGADNLNKRYEDIFTKDNIFNEEIDLLEGSILKLESPVKVDNWPEEYGVKNNNISNFSYSGYKGIISKSGKLNKLTRNRNIIFYENNLISFDHKGKIFIYSLDTKKKTFEYNFYKKNFKNFKKELYLAVNNNILYAADNLGYVYSIDLKNRSLVWAKNYGIPFRSNLKITKEQLLLANQDNVIYAINPNTGDKEWQFATSLTFLKSDFMNNFAIDENKKNIFFLNTSGELYSINRLDRNINWILNFKSSSFAEETALFLSQPLVIKNNNLIVSTEKRIMSLESSSGIRNWLFNSNPMLKPVATKNYIYMVSKNDLLICLNNSTGEVLWSKKIFTNIERKTIKKIGKIHDFKIANNELNLFSKNGYLLSFSYRDGNFNYLKKISKNGISSKVIFIKNNMLLIDNSNKLLKFN